MLTKNNKTARLIKFLKVTFYALLVFISVSYISVMTSLLSSTGKSGINPTTNIGFPFKYYYQFWVNDNPYPNYGWCIKCFVYDFLIVWGITFLLTFKLLIPIKKIQNKF